MVLVSCPVHDELLAAQMFSSLPVPAQAVGRFALFVAEVQALSFGVDEDDRKVAAVLLAVGAHDVLGALVSVTVVVRVVPAGHLGGCDNGGVCVVVRDEGLRGLPGARVQRTDLDHGDSMRPGADKVAGRLVAGQDPKLLRDSGEAFTGGDVGGAALYGEPTGRGRSGIDVVGSHGLERVQY